MYRGTLDQMPPDSGDAFIGAIGRNDDVDVLRNAIENGVLTAPSYVSANYGTAHSEIFGARRAS
jgi:hypothetical protein